MRDTYIQEVNEFDKTLEYFDKALEKYSLDNIDRGMIYFYLRKLYMKKTLEKFKESVKFKN